MNKVDYNKKILKSVNRPFDQKEIILASYDFQGKTYYEVYEGKDFLRKSDIVDLNEANSLFNYCMDNTNYDPND